MFNYPTIHGIKINNSNGNVSIPANTTFSLSFDGYFNDYNRIETGNLYILATFSGSPESCLYVTMNGHTEKSHSFFDNSKSIYWLVIDLTHFLRFGFNNAKTSLYITNESNSPISINCADSYIEMTYLKPFFRLNKFEYYQQNINDSFSFRQELFSLLSYYDYPLFDGQLMFDLSLTFDSYHSGVDLFGFFPNGWKINILECITGNNPISIWDENGNEKQFKSADSPVELYVEESGSGLLLEYLADDEYYKLFSPISSGFKLFDLSYRLREIHLENGKIIHIYYSNSSIEIVDWAGNHIYLNKTNSSTITISCSSSPQVYTLTIDQDNNLTNISSLSESGTALTDCLTYSDDGEISSISTYDGFTFTRSYNGFQTLIRNSFNNHDKEYLTFSKSGSVTILENHLKQVITKYFFEKDNDFSLFLQYEPRSNEENAFNNALCYLSNCFSISSSKLIVKAKQIAVRPPDFESSSYKISQAVTQQSNSYTKLFLIETSEFINNPENDYYLLFKIKQNKTWLNNPDNSNALILYESSNSLLPIDIILETFIDEEEQFVLVRYKKPYNGQAYENRYLTFAIKDNTGIFELSNVFSIELIDREQKMYYKRSNVLEPYLFHNESYCEIDNVLFLGHGEMHEQDIKMNKVIYGRFGFPKYVYTDNLSNVVHYLNENTNINVLINSTDTCNFATTHFLFRTRMKDDNYISFVNSSNSYYLCSTYRLVGNNEYHSSTSIDYYENIREKLDFLGITKTYTYNNNHFLTNIATSSLNTEEIVEEHGYDQYGRLTSSSKYIGSKLATTTYSYISTLNVINSIIDPLNKTTNYEYASYYKYRKKISKTISNVIHYVQTTRNNFNDITNLADGGNSFDFTYSSSLNELAEIKNHGSLFPSISFARNNLQNGGEVLSLTYWNDNNIATFSKTYDKYGRIIEYKQTYPTNGFVVNFTYDSNYSEGRLSQITDNSGYVAAGTVYSYNDQNQIAIVLCSDYCIYSTTFQYNDQDCVLSKTNKIISSGNSEFQYLVGVTNTYFYLESNNELFRTNISLFNVIYNNQINLISHIKSSDALNRPISLLTEVGNNSIGFSSIEYFSITGNKTSYQVRKTTNTTEGNRFYTYDKRGNITKVATNSSLLSPGHTYSYDDKNQLTQESFGDISNTQIVYSYDTCGNIISAVKTYIGTSISIKGDRDLVTETDTYIYSSGDNKKLVSFNGVSITYDQIGNPLNLNGATLTYYRGHKLRTYTKGTTSITYDYNYQGLRVRKLVGSTEHKYIYEDDRLIRENRSNGSSSTSFLYFYGLNGVLGFRYGDDTYLYEKNIFNDVIAIYKITSSGLSLSAKYQYYAYGNVEVFNALGTNDLNMSSIGNINPFRYRSYYYDTDTGYYYCKSRYYVPFLRRWLTPDNPAYLNNNHLIGLNPYAYCYNNPIAYVDPDGCMVAWAIGLITGAIIGTLIGGIYGGLTAASQGKTSWQIVGAIGIGALVGSIMGAASGFGSSVLTGGIGIGIIAEYSAAAWGISLGASSFFGAAGGCLLETLSQVLYYGRIQDRKSIGWSALQGAALNILSMFATCIGGGVGVSWAANLGFNFVMGFQVSSISFVIDMFRYFVWTSEDEKERKEDLLVDLDYVW